MSKLMQSPVLLATTNQKKIGEMRRLLLPLGFQIADVDVSTAPEIEENGATFAQNAAIKAIGQAKHFGMIAIGEDSGLVVPALNGEPGLFSARYAGRPHQDPRANDEANNDLLLSNMVAMSGEQRAGYYVSAIAMADPQGKVLTTAYGECHGRLLTQRRGSNGFGYDPLFEIVELHRTFAELPAAVKSAISHRGRSLRMFLRQMGKW